jgi:hypothetical protein
MNKKKRINKINIEKRKENGLIYQNMENNLYLEQKLNENRKQSKFDKKKIYRSHQDSNLESPAP